MQAAKQVHTSDDSEPVRHDNNAMPCLLFAGNDVWRLEPVKLEWAGLPLQHGVQLRVRHVPSGRYLTADGAKAVAAAESLRASKLVRAHRLSRKERTQGTCCGGCIPGYVALLSHD